MAELLEREGYFSVLRWRNDATRDEARNVAVILVEEKGRFGGLRAAPLSRVSPRLHDQGLLDAMLVGLEKRFAALSKPNLAALQSMRQELQHSLYLTDPKPVLVPDTDATLSALFRAYVAPPAGGSRTPTKGIVLDRVVRTLRKQGYELRRSQYVKGFMFDLVFDSPKRIVGEVLSFATGATNWLPVENDAGHFLYGLRRLNSQGLAVVQPPADGNQTAIKSHQRVIGWLQDEKVRSIEPEELAEAQRSLGW